MKLPKGVTLSLPETEAVKGVHAGTTFTIKQFVTATHTVTLDHPLEARISMHTSHRGRVRWFSVKVVNLMIGTVPAVAAEVSLAPEDNDDKIKSQFEALVHATVELLARYWDDIVIPPAASVCSYNMAAREVFETLGFKNTPIAKPKKVKE